ncbi:hypothetical protein, partial [Brevundimonas sp.]|uniref:beta strand repeat-containing protein n=1 Tax=Brevundimonas sp. TaxID=1871086 RepID=UPI0028962EA5
SGGISIAGGVSGSGKGAGAVTFGLGGSGGTGGAAGTVQADVSGVILTKGAYSGAVLAQSVGGGGGSGGMNVSAGLSGGVDGAGNLVIGIGGAGGGGGDGNTVKGTVRSDIETQGANSFGLTYQSIGGGGGSGGMNISAGASLGQKGSGNIVFGLGGSGGAGGNGALADLDYSGSIFTSGDFSHGILVQSAGGGGGSGGLNVSAGVAVSEKNAGNLVIGIGGAGGGGGNADKVLGTLAGNVTTQGANAFGSLLQSLGGGGGAGGINISGGVAGSFGQGMTGSLVFGLGGFGGDGGNGADVTGTVTGNYLTQGAGSFGVGAQSIGGGGGNGGLNVSGSVALAQGDTASVAIGLGGFGGGGGDAGKVNLTRTGDTQTEGAGADGVLVQSIGGGGGNGGINISGTFSDTVDKSATAISFGLGGFGGDGGDAGEVTATVKGNVWAKGIGSDVTNTWETAEGMRSFRIREGGSHGVVAQSIGGGGGNGGINIAAGIATTPPQSGTARTLNIGIGGFAGGGGNASKVKLTVASADQDGIQIQANGDNRSAVLAQSIGGGGGNGGLNVSAGVAHDGQLTVGIGGFGGDGGHADAVDVNVRADLYAAGNMSRGLTAQSIGGGGGSGAINISGGFQYNTEAKEPIVTFGLGGFGGGGGYSGDVNASLFGNVMIEGVDSVGALVQSIAGGGGSGGLNITAAGTIGNDKSYVLGAGVGGSGGDGDDAGDVNFTNTGNILVGGQFVTGTDGKRTFVAADHVGGGAGVIVQSIGGGGGTGGINVTGAATKKGSVMSLGVGGSGGSGGHAGAVTVSRGWNGTDAAPGIIETFGAGTQGLVAQSIGGGGGNAGHNLVLGLKLSSVDDKQGDGYGVLMAVGGGGAGAGSGQAVDVDHNGTIITHGNLADGIVAQSIGGGGGNAAFNLGGAIFNKAKAALNVAIGGATGAAGSGGTVDVDHTGDIFTEGKLARGIIAQSIGGGGGNSGTDMAIGIFAVHSLSTTIGRQGGTGGTGGAVNVNLKGKDSRVITLGDYSDGILAQSIGGGGGTSGVIAVSGSTRESTDKQSKGGGVSVGINGGHAAVSDDVTISNEGTIYTGGDEARGILAQSIGGGGGIGGSASATLVFAGSGAWLA